MADEIKQLVEKLLAAIMDIKEERVEQVPSALTVSVQKKIRATVCNAMEHHILYQKWTAILRETMDKHVNNYIEGGKAAEVLPKRLLRKGGFLALITSNFKAKTVDAITDHCKMGTLRKTHTRNRPARTQR